MSVLNSFVILHKRGGRYTPRTKSGTGGPPPNKDYDDWPPLGLLGHVVFSFPRLPLSPLPRFKSYWTTFPNQSSECKPAAWRDSWTNALGEGAVRSCSFLPRAALANTWAGEDQRLQVPGGARGAFARRPVRKRNPTGVW